MSGVRGIVLPISLQFGGYHLAVAAQGLGGQVSPNGLRLGRFHSFGACCRHLSAISRRQSATMRLRAVARVARQRWERRRQPLSTVNVMPTAVSSGGRVLVVR